VTGRPDWPGLVELHEVVDVRGALIIAETSRQLPFAVHRVFFILDVPEGEPRGIHAHRECHQFLICLRGSVKAMVDDGDRREVVRLDRGSVGLYMPPLTWGTQYDYSPDAVLAVLASHPYDADDYIHDYEEFLAIAAPASRP
jgi:hypothetical protein